jgi:DNA-binding MarR family transcriptional regulator
MIVMASATRLRDEDYRRLRDVRAGLRAYLRWSEERAGEVGLTPAHHQLLLGIRAHEDERGPTIGEMAQLLMLKHHSSVELVDRAQRAGLIRRVPDPLDHRIVRLRLTSDGIRRLEGLAAQHVAELARLAPRLSRLWRGLQSVEPKRE